MVDIVVSVGKLILNIPGYIATVISFITTFLFELPAFLLEIFVLLPDFVQGGIVVIVAFYIVMLVLKFISLFRESTV